MMKKKLLVVIVMTVLASVLLTGCSDVNEAQFQLVFGKSTAELIPSVGNAAYVNRPLNLGAADVDGSACSTDPEDVASAAASAAAAQYVDPTEGLDCSE